MTAIVVMMSAAAYFLGAPWFRQRVPVPIQLVLAFVFYSTAPVALLYVLSLFLEGTPIWDVAKVVAVSGSFAFFGLRVVVARGDRRRILAEQQAWRDTRVRAPISERGPSPNPWRRS